MQFYVTYCQPLQIHTSFNYILGGTPVLENLLLIWLIDATGDTNMKYCEKKYFQNLHQYEKKFNFIYLYLQYILYILVWHL